MADFGWVHVDGGFTGTSQTAATYAITLDENTTTSQRVKQLRFKSKNGFAEAKTFTITQPGKTSYVKMVPTSTTFPSTGGYSIDFSIDHSDDITYCYKTECPSWIRYETYESTGFEGTLYNEDNTGTTRSGNIVIYGNTTTPGISNPSYTITFTQSGATPTGSITVDNHYIKFDANCNVIESEVGNTSQFIVNASDSWKATVDENWCLLDIWDGGVGSTNNEVYVEKNEDSPRSATITIYLIANPDIKVEIDIYQYFG